MAARFALKSTHATSSSAIAKRRKQKQKLKLKLKKQQKKPQQKPSLVDLSHYQRFVASPLPRTLRFPLPPAFLLDPSLPELSLDPRDLLLCSDSLYLPHDAFAACAEKLMESKLEIMASRMRYGMDVWTLAAQIVNPYEIISCIAAPVLNRAFFKMWELIQTFPLVPSVDQNPRFLSAHLCEGPGGFVQALLTYRSRSAEGREGLFEGRDERSPSSVIQDGCNRWTDYMDSWFAITLAKPLDQKQIKDAGDALKMQTMKLEKSRVGSVKGHVHYGADHSGDIMNPENISSFVEYVLQQSNGEKMHLITGDGAFDVSDDFAVQEQSHSHLLFSEMVTAVRLQAHGGSFVLKLFDCFTETTVAIIFILASLYSNVEVVRLRTSRVCNSERFVVAQGFRGLRSSLEDRFMQMSIAWCKAINEGDAAAVGVKISGKLHCPFLEALASSNAHVVDEEVKSINLAVLVAENLGERLSLTDGPGTRKGILSILRRKLKTMQKLRTNAYSLCEALDIPQAKAWK